MKDKVIIHGVEYVPKVVIEPTPAKVGRWRPEDDEKYWYIDGNDGAIVHNAWCEEGNYCCHFRGKHGNIYQTEALAIRARDRQLLLVKLQDFADQKNEGKEAFGRCYLLAKFGDDWNWLYTSKCVPGTVRFRNVEDALDAIAHFGDRLDLLL